MVEQVGGTHYSRLEYQTWDFIIDLNIDFLTGNVIKYISRFQNKNGIEDLKKAKSYLIKIIESNYYVYPVDLSDKRVKRYLDQFDSNVKSLLKMALTKDYDVLVNILDV